MFLPYHYQKLLRDNIHSAYHRIHNDAFLPCAVFHVAPYVYRVRLQLPHTRQRPPTNCCLKETIHNRKNPRIPNDTVHSQSHSLRSILLYAKNMNISNLFHGRVYLFAICLQKSRKPPGISGFLLEKSHSLLSIPAPAAGFPLRWPDAPPLKTRCVPVQRRNCGSGCNPPSPRSPRCRGRNIRRSQSRRPHTPAP